MTNLIILDKSVQSSILNNITFFNVNFRDGNFIGNHLADCNFKDCRFNNVMLVKCEF